jgi:hypothetical protein
MKKKMVLKSSGQQEPFDREKFQRSLKKAGASEKIIDQLTREVESRSELTSTRAIYGFAMTALQASSPALAARYNLKRALQELGPHGYPFEKYVAALLEREGYKKTEVDVILQGTCVEHEIDVLAQSDKAECVVEAKFHNRYGRKTEIQVALYVKARFDDLRSYHEVHHRPKTLETLLVTNTQFTAEAIKYAQCVNLPILGWGYPYDNGLAERIERHQLVPITALTTLYKKAKEQLIARGKVLCSELPDSISELKRLGIKPPDIDKIVAECEGVCELGI